MGFYMKKPVVIEAKRVPEVIEFNEPAFIDSVTNYVNECVDLAEWCGGISHMMDPPEGYEHGIYIRTIEGTMRADPGDWIIKGVQGEFYPCKPDIFEATYEPVPEDGSFDTLTVSTEETTELEWRPGEDLSLGQYIRIIALEQATMLSSNGATSGHVLDVAKRYEKFINGSDTTVINNEETTNG